MKHFTYFLLLLLLIAIPSCNNNFKSKEQLRAECDSLLHLAVDSYKADLREAAYNYCNQAILLDTTYWRSYAVKANAYYYDKNYDSAIVAYEKFYTLNKDQDTISSGNMYRMASTYTNLEQYDKALIIAQEGLLVNPNDFWLMDEVSLCYAKQQKYELAEKWAMRALDTHDNDKGAFFRLAWINGEIGRTGKAIEYYEKILELDPDGPNVSGCMNNLSILYWNEDRGKAIKLRKKAAQLGDINARKWCKENGYDY